MPQLEILFWPPKNSYKNRSFSGENGDGHRRGAWLAQLEGQVTFDLSSSPRYSVEITRINK